jgi:hypothetical protein
MQLVGELNLASMRIEAASNKYTATEYEKGVTAGLRLALVILREECACLTVKTVVVPEPTPESTVEPITGNIGNTCPGCGGLLKEITYFKTPPGHYAGTISAKVKCDKCIYVQEIRAINKQGVLMQIEMATRQAKLTAGLMSEVITDIPGN